MSINTQEYSNTITANASFTAQGYGQTQFNITGDDATITDSENVDVFTSNVTVNNSTGVNITGNSIDSISITGSSQTTNIDLNSGDLSFTGNANSTNVISGANTVQATGTNYYIYYSTVYLTGAAS
jgi:lipopolysaccharide export system protein LptA